MNVLFSIPAVLSTLSSIALGAAVPARAASDLSKRRETCGDLGGCPGFVLGNYYMNYCLADSTGGTCVFGQDWTAADGTRYTDVQYPHCDPAAPCTGSATTGTTNTCTWVAGNQYANCL
ncbi:hypothetical protein BGZ57DRAFT_932457 [Hyaloscypha finlandica]|nr:hypothetical protein BGZ57DRAFT_932457 [Hyaloscypha finlandica]